MSSLVLLVGLAALLVYLFATRDNDYIPIADRPQDLESKRQSINYYGWRGPMFVEDFTNFSGANNPKEQLVPVVRCGVTPDGKDDCDIPKYNRNVPGMLDRHQQASEQCQLPDTLTSEESWRNEYHNSVYRLGGPDGYRQVTNNNLSAPNNLKAAQMKSVMGDWFDPKDKISPWCYAQSFSV